MRYLITLEPKEPFAENWRKCLALEEERSRKGVHIGKEGFVLDYHLTLKSAPSFVGVIETDDANLLLRALLDYTDLAKCEIIPVVERHQYVKSMGVEPTSPST
jgi:hypothetical protein